MIDLNKVRHVHFVGIGGIGMSGIAEMLLKQDYIVTGSDIRSTNITAKLVDKGAKIFLGHSEDQVIGSDLVVYTAAANNTNPELIKAKELEIQTLSRAEVLGLLMDQYNNSIAISGTHGKTTTTSMLSLILENADFDPTMLIGGELNEINGNAKIGKSDYLITEACEYKDSFLNFKPKLGVVLNIDEDHLDYFDGLEHIVKSFTSFAKEIPKNGYLFVNHDDFSAKRLKGHVDCNIVTFGITLESNYQARNITFNSSGHPSFNVFYNDELLEKFELTVPGMHNIYNSLAAISVSVHLGVPLEVIKSTLHNFLGAKRRFERIGEKHGSIIFDDYAHHPSEIKATLAAATKYPYDRIWCVFQPHTYTRTNELLMEFAQAFKDADKVIITDIYAAREENTIGIHSKDLVKLIEEENVDVVYLETFDEIVDHLNQNVSSGDMILTMGAGNINKVAYQYLGINPS